MVKYDGIVHAYARAPVELQILILHSRAHPNTLGSRKGGGAVMTFDLALPAPNVPVGSYVMAVHSGDFLFLSGHGAFEDGRPVYTGRLGETMTSEQGARAAETVMLNMLATIEPSWATCRVWEGW